MLGALCLDLESGDKKPPWMKEALNSDNSVRPRQAPLSGETFYITRGMFLYFSHPKFQLICKFGNYLPIQTAPAVLEVDLGDRSRSSSRPPPPPSSAASTQPRPPLTSYRRNGRRGSRGKFSVLGNLRNAEWPCREMTNFHCYLMIGLTGFFIFWLLLLLRDRDKQSLAFSSFVQL